MAEQKSNSPWVFDEEEFDLGKVAKLSDEEITTFRDIAFKIRHPDGKREVPWPSDCNPTREVFGDNLATQYVYEWKNGNLWNRAYEVEVTAFIALEYKLDFSSSKDCDIQSAFNRSGDVVTIALQPFEREIIASITASTIEDNKYNIKGSWAKTKIDPLLFQQSIVLANNKIKADYDKCLAAGLNETVSWDEMPPIIRNKGILFVDGEFYPSQEALYYKGANDPKAIANKNDDKYIMWRRASDFIDFDLPVIFKDSNNLNQSIQPQHVRMGSADNAWLMSVVSVMALKPALIANLFLSKDGANNAAQNNEDKMYGFYRMRLCDRGVWTECIIDDVLPCQPYYRPVMAHTKDNDQLWPHLIEKVYAKVRGNCYEALDEGNPAAAFMDLTGYPIEIFDVQECDTDLLFEKINKSYNGSYNMLAVAICNADGRVDDVEGRIGLLSTHTYSVLGINMNEERIRLRDPFGKNEDKFKGQYNTVEKNKDGIIWVSFGEFVEYFSNVTVCYSANDYKEARQTIDISYDREKKEVSVPVLKLTVPNGGNVEYLGLSQKDIMSRDPNETRKQQLDMCLFVFKSNGNGNTLDATQDTPYGYIPMSTQGNKFVKFGASADDVKSNDLSTGLTWKNGDRLTDGTYYLVPWTSGVQWESEQKGNDGDVQYIGLTVHGQCGGGAGFSIAPVDGYTAKDIDPVLLAYAFKYGEKKQWEDLERRHFQCGQLDVWAGRNTCQDKNLLFSMTPSEATNVTNALGYTSFRVGQEQKFKVEVGQTTLFAVNVPINPFNEYSSVYKYALTNEWL
eukprot:179827_1